MEESAILTTKTCFSKLVDNLPLSPVPFNHIWYYLRKGGHSNTAVFIANSKHYGGWHLNWCWKPNRK